MLFHQKEEHQWVSSMQEKATTEYQVLEVNASIYSFVQDTDFEIRKPKHRNQQYILSCF